MPKKKHTEAAPLFEQPAPAPELTKWQKWHKEWWKNNKQKAREYHRRREAKLRSDPVAYAAIVEKRQARRKWLYHNNAMYRARILKANRVRWQKALKDPVRYEKLEVLRKNDFEKNWIARMLPH